MNALQLLAIIQSSGTLSDVAMRAKTAISESPKIVSTDVVDIVTLSTVMEDLKTKLNDLFAEHLGNTDTKFRVNISNVTSSNFIRLSITPIGKPSLFAIKSCNPIHPAYDPLFAWLEKGDEGEVLVAVQFDVPLKSRSGYVPMEQLSSAKTMQRWNTVATFVVEESFEFTESRDQFMTLAFRYNGNTFTLVRAYPLDRHELFPLSRPPTALFAFIDTPTTESYDAAINYFTQGKLIAVKI